ncbi:MAG: hypothetical protein AAFY88_22920 [Acidobacteriota bacterium]
MPQPPRAFFSAQSLTTYFFAALGLTLCPWITTPAAPAQSFVLEVQVSPEQAGTIPVFEVIWGGDVETLDVYRFARDCEYRAGVSSGDDWSVTQLSTDDLLTCSFKDATGTLEMDIETTTQPPRLNGSGLTSESKETLSIHFMSDASHELRVRFGSQSEPWSQWVRGTLDWSLPVPLAGQESSIHFDLEMREDANSGTVGMSGYIKTKKLNSGD